MPARGDGPKLNDVLNLRKKVSRRKTEKGRQQKAKKIMVEGKESTARSIGSDSSRSGRVVVLCPSLCVGQRSTSDAVVVSGSKEEAARKITNETNGNNKRTKKVEVMKNQDAVEHTEHDKIVFLRRTLMRSSSKRSAKSLSSSQSTRAESASSLSCSTTTSQSPSPENNKSFAKMDDEGKDNDPLILLPRYLSPYVRHHHGDFYVSLIFDPRLIVQLMAEGFLPIAASNSILLPKLHSQRCVIRPLENLHIAKSTKKKFGKFCVSINRDWDGVVRGCLKQHGESWLYPSIVRAFNTLREAGTVSATLFDHNHDDASSSSPPKPIGRCLVRLYSIEVWNAETKELAAGELGYTVGGRIYTSLTGFSSQQSAGSVQLAALGILLQSLQFTTWDLGMSMPYKERLGSTLMDRDDWVHLIRSQRTDRSHVVLNFNHSTGGTTIAQGDEMVGVKDFARSVQSFNEHDSTPQDTSSNDKAATTKYTKHNRDKQSMKLQKKFDRNYAIACQQEMNQPTQDVNYNPGLC